MIRALTLLWLLGSALAGDPTPDDGLGPSDPPLLSRPEAGEARQRTDALARRLRCPVCQALSVADSTSEAARSMYERIGELVAQGYSDEQITDYFAERYGEWVLLEPPAEGMNWLIFLAPAGALALGGAAVWGALTRRQEPPPAPAPPRPADPYREQILRELAERESPAKRGG